MQENGLKIKTIKIKMKKLPLLLLAFSLFNFSCSSDDSGTPVTPEPEIPEVTDDFKFLSVNSAGKIFEIGNNTGYTETIGHITSQANLLMLSTICNVGSKIYAIESSYVPAPNILTIYDKVTKTTTTQQLTLPTTITTLMNDPFITNLEYNGSEFIAIVSDNMSSHNPPRMISINPQNYQTTDLEISFTQRDVISTELINNKLYVSTQQGLLEINLTTKTITELQANGTQIVATRLAKISNTRLALMCFVPGVVNGVKPFEYNLTNNTLTEKATGNVAGVGHPSGASIFHNDQYLNLVFTTESKFGISKINYEINQAQFVELNHDLIGSNAIIVDILE
jgi:hypothetical protein